MTLRRIDQNNCISVPSKLLAAVATEPSDFVFFEPNRGSLGCETSWVDENRRLEIDPGVMARRGLKPGDLVALSVKQGKLGPTIVATAERVSVEGDTDR